MATHLVWLRNDLRLNDNSALWAACRRREDRVIALFIATPGQWRRHNMSPRQADYIWRSLQLLQQGLAEKGIALHYHQCDDFNAAVSYLQQFCRERQVKALFYNYQYEFNERERDAAVERLLPQQGVTVQGFDDGVLLPPGSVRTGNQKMYKVFTPFSRACLKRLRDDLPPCLPAPEARADATADEPSTLTPFDYPRHSIDEQLFPPGEAAALRRLREFCRQQVADYPARRDYPAYESTSRLSVCLAVGTLSPRQCLHRLLREQPHALEAGPGSVWLNELIWRDFYRHLLVAFPALCKNQPFMAWTKQLAWQQRPEQFNAWCEGKTGFPIVDAAMRQMNATGWMHNRLRMITASFLVKDLQIDWRRGERYFMSVLIDGDLAANNGGWQWAASTGTDAVPYFRIFNPTTQGERFDKQGEFIRRWLPELAAVPDSAIHDPHGWAKKNHQRLDYPQPIVEHKAARQQTLAIFEAARKASPVISPEQVNEQF
ncbi:MAG: deoxyribodipyrimidine photo-lyase [Mixta calida]|uniref:deoxyribodipyrimidine photo-lyase n=1 Tax=Mixta calida TaxID=665913 RepID=UPI00290B9088|nr:deoxyribodipyrimidine photo-lyase [Mixta calida]MDU4940284.1 deoxyribodipyrimidine photo-lyase [Mixta calida]